MSGYLRFRYRRLVRRFRRDIRLSGLAISRYLDRHIWGKWHQAHLIRRFLILWWLLVAIAVISVWQQISYLGAANEIAVPQSGGIYTEAAVGNVSTLNPLLPQTATETDIDSLIFSGLTRYNSRGQVVPDLATWQISPDGQTYTFHLRHGVKWQDGVPFTAADVAFTMTAIQSPDSRSPLESSWQGVQVATSGDYTVAFTLPQPLSSFLDSTTVGVVPRHLLEDVNPTDLYTTSFNQHPVGTGPFELKTFAPQADEIQLTSNPNYYFGRPKIDEFDYKLFGSPADALTAYAQHQVTSPGRILPQDITNAESQTGLVQYGFTLPEEATLFFNNSDPVLSEKALRLILSESLNRQKILQGAEEGQGIVVSQPILPGQLGYTDRYAPSTLSQAETAAALTADGWLELKKGAPRTKAGHSLKFTIDTLSGSEMQQAAQQVQRQWAPLGIQVRVNATSETNLQQTYMRPRNFQMLLYGINVGADPDVYAYWHSSQSQDPGVNLSQYNDATADKALESGRISNNPQVRTEKYNQFLQSWDADAPAAILYQLGYTYATSNSVQGIEAKHLIAPSDRYYDVQRWTVRDSFQINL